MRAWRTGALLVITTVVATMFVPGCRSAPDGIPEPEGAAPQRADVLAAWNARTDALERLWARAVVVVDAPGELGERVTEQGEGHLQIIRPDRVALSLGKNVAGTFFWLGSDDTRYWWIDMLDEERTFALVGTHARATPERAAALGVPVHPLDLVEVLGVLPLDAGSGGDVLDELRALRWDAEFGGYELLGSSRFGTKRIVVAPVTFEPVVIELLDPAGEIVVRARHERFASVVRREGGGLPGSIATRLRIELPTIDARVTMTLSEAENRGSRMPAAAFDLDGLLRRFGIGEVIDLDAEPGPTARTAVGDVSDAGRGA